MSKAQESVLAPTLLGCQGNRNDLLKHPQLLLGARPWSRTRGQIKLSPVLRELIVWKPGRGDGFLDRTQKEPSCSSDFLVQTWSYQLLNPWLITCLNLLMQSVSLSASFRDPLPKESPKECPMPTAGSTFLCPGSFGLCPLHGKMW